ncbi:MAG: phosphodiester glycosidase family protein [Clostridia bacterium]|nr:phosphodiester glycosidase family protein [Clostridia bacterium]
MRKSLFFLSLLMLIALPLIPSGAALAELHRAQTTDELPEVLDSGFLAESDGGWYYQNHEEGLWIYLSSTERVEITRNQTTSPKMTWYVADIVCRRGTTLFTRSWNEKKPGKTQGLPQDIAQRDHVVFAMSGDFYSYRVKHDRYPGVIIRDGSAIYKKTYSKYVRAVPNLDTIAFFPSGKAEVNESHEVSAKEYLSRGAETVLAFGPVLLRNGEIPDLSYKDFTHLEPRLCLGIVEDGHYIALLVEGRKTHSDGATLQTCAQILQDLGCDAALNLDGGNTAAMLFLSESVQLSNSGGVDVNDRPIPDIIGVGTY